MIRRGVCSKKAVAESFPAWTPTLLVSQGVEVRKRPGRLRNVRDQIARKTVPLKKRHPSLLAKAERNRNREGEEEKTYGGPGPDGTSLSISVACIHLLGARKGKRERTWGVYRL